MNIYSIIDKSQNFLSQAAATVTNIDKVKLLHYGRQLINYGRQKPVISLITTIATVYFAVVLSSFVLGASSYFVGRTIEVIPFINNFWFVENVADWFKTKGEKAMFFSTQLIHFVFVVSIEGIFAPIGKCISQHIFSPIFYGLVPIVFFKCISFFWKDKTNTTTDGTNEAHGDIGLGMAKRDVALQNQMPVWIQSLPENLNAIAGVITKLQITNEDAQQFLKDVHTLARPIRPLLSIKHKINTTAPYILLAMLYYAVGFVFIALTKPI
jgi:hypothetical protein